MFVIISDMDLPKCCGDCELHRHYHRCGFWCSVSEDKKADNCPLKSSDEVLEELLKRINSLDMLTSIEDNRLCVSILDVFKVLKEYFKEGN